MTTQSARERYRQRLRDAKRRGTHTRAEWEAVCRRFFNLCVRCFVRADDLIGGSLTKDHVIPISENGSDAAGNLQPLCRECNTSKKADSVERRDYRVDFIDRYRNYIDRSERGITT